MSNNRRRLTTDQQIDLHKFLVDSKDEIEAKRLTIQNVTRLACEDLDMSISPCTVAARMKNLDIQYGGRRDGKPTLSTEVTADALVCEIINAIQCLYAEHGKPLPRVLRSFLSEHDDGDYAVADNFLKQLTLNGVTDNA